MSHHSHRLSRQEHTLTVVRALLQEDRWGLSMRSLARAAGISVNTLYALFSTRNGVLQALVEQALVRRAELLAGVEPHSGEPMVSLEAILRAITEPVLAQPDYWRPVYRAASDLRALERPLIRSVSEPLLRGLQELSHSGRILRELPLQPYAELLGLTVHQAVLSWSLGEISAEELVSRSRRGLHLVISALSEPRHLRAHQDRLRELTGSSRSSQAAELR